MPSPIVHTAAGYLLYRIRKPSTDRQASRSIGPLPVLLLATVGLSLLPDLDAIPGLLTDDLGRFHNNVTHSLIFGLIVSAIVGGVVWWRHRSGFGAWFVTALLCYETHVILDLFTVGRGVMLFWPFSADRYMPPVALFYGLHWSEGLISTRHLWTVATELASVALVALVAFAAHLATARTGRKKRSQRRIGIMLRSYDEKGGVGVYTRNLVEELLAIDRHNHYVLFWRDPGNVGRFAQHSNVTERLVKGKNNALWDQVLIPYACWQEKVDVVFHPKFTAPLLAPCKAVMVLHGIGWFVEERGEFFNRWDLQYIRRMMPVYLKKCAAVISVSRLTTEGFNRLFGLPPGKVQTVYFAPARHFARMTDEARLQQVRERYGLPERFILTLTKPGGHRRKNFGGVLEAYERYHQRTSTPHPLVVGGKDCERFRDEYGIPAEGYGRDILFPGWIDQEDMPEVLSMADLYLYPSKLEAFPIPITEAMACGTPIITSNANGLKEIAGDAALFVDPDDREATARAIGRVLSDAELRARLSASGLARSREFTWDLCTRKTLAVLESLAV